MSLEVWADINQDGDVIRFHTSNGQKPVSKFLGGGKYSVTLKGNFSQEPWVLATVRAPDDNPTNKVISVIDVQKDLVTFGIKDGNNNTKRPFTFRAYQP